MRDFTECELCEMFSVGGIPQGIGPAEESMSGVYLDPHAPGEEWHDLAWQLTARNPVAKTRQYREDDGLSSADKAKLLAHHSARVANEIDFSEVDHWRNILGLPIAKM